MMLPTVDPTIVKRIAMNIPRAGLGGIQLSPGTMGNLFRKGLMLPAQASPPRGMGNNGLVSAGDIQKAVQNGAIFPLAPGVQPADLASDPALYYDIDRSLQLNPWVLLPQHFKVYPLPGTVAGGVLTFAPQRKVIPFAAVFREAEATGTIAALQVGVVPLFGNGQAVPAGMFGPMSPDTRYLPPVIAVPGQQITANVTGVTRAALWCADVDATQPMAEPLRSRLTPVGFALAAGAFGAGVAAQIVIQPQINIRLRRVAFLNPSASGDFASCPDITVESVLVGNQPQTEAAGSIPLDAFLNTYLAGYLDADLCQIGNSITLGVTNHTGGGLALSGAIYGDTQ